MCTCAAVKSFTSLNIEGRLVGRVRHLSSASDAMQRIHIFKEGKIEKATNPWQFAETFENSPRHLFAQISETSYTAMCEINIREYFLSQYKLEAFFQDNSSWHIFVRWHIFVWQRPFFVTQIYALRTCPVYLAYQQRWLVIFLSELTTIIQG